MTDQETQSNLNRKPEPTEPEQATSPEQTGQQEQRAPASGQSSLYRVPPGGGRSSVLTDQESGTRAGL